MSSNMTRHDMKLKREPDIEQQIHETLAEFDSPVRIKADPYFTTRMLARIREEADPAFQFRWRHALLGIMVAVNIITAVFVLQRRSHTESNREAYVDAFATEYTLSSVTNFSTVDQ